MTKWRYRFWLLIALLYIGCSSVAGQTALPDLDKAIAQRQQYYNKHEEKLEEMKRDLVKAKEDKARLALLYRIMEGYKYYQYDSAFHYANLGVRLAETLSPSSDRAESLINVAYCLVTGGLFKEAGDLLEDIGTMQMDSVVHQKHLELLSKYYYDMAEYNSSNKYFHNRYKERALILIDSLLTLIPQGGRLWYDYLGQKEMMTGRYGSAKEIYEHILTLSDLSPHALAIAHANLAHIALALSHYDEAIEHFARSARYDIESATRENTANGLLAQLMYEKGKLTEANRYIKVALEDANFYNAQHRKVAIGYIQPFIEEGRYELVSSQKERLTGSLVVISILCILLVGAFLVIYKQIRTLRQAKRTIEEDNRTLHRTNQKLIEANIIKDEYIGSSFFNYSENIQYLETLYQSISQKLQDRHYDEVKAMLKKSTLVKERKDMYTNFDTTFLKLFPDFIEGYNALFPPEERIVLSDKNELTPELRIFALVRLGITKSEQIAQFLNYSVHTINTYKTKTKNKSLVDNKEFETVIQSIGSNPNAR